MADPRGAAPDEPGAAGAFRHPQASEIHDNFYEIQQKFQWAAGMPTNALLVSGPSKTADIEQVLAYGAHGPKDLILLILEDA